MNKKELFFSCVWLAYVVLTIFLSFEIAFAGYIGESAIMVTMWGLYLAYEIKKTFLDEAEKLEEAKQKGA